MNEVMKINATDYRPVAEKTLNKSVQFWFLTAVIGQWIMVYYLIVHFGLPAIVGSFDNFAMVESDSTGNILLIAHVLIGAAIMGFGPLQLVPQLRSRMPKLHFWSGRIYILAVFIACFAGLYTVWTRDLPGGIEMKIALNIMVVLTLFFAVTALRFAMKRQITQHRRWALRLFIIANAGWFFRVGLMGWVLINGGPVGFDFKTFEGPFIQFMAFGQFVLPLAGLELYLRAKDSQQAWVKSVAAASIVLFTLLMGIGIFGAAKMMWLPYT